MNEIMKSFDHEYFGEIRTLVKDGEPWFVAKDVASVLGYSRTADAIRTHCKGVGETQTPTARGKQLVKIIPERDVYRLIMKSKLPQAERFEEWVVGEVLPSIRKHGGYIRATVEENPEEIMARALVVAQQTLKRVEEQKELAESQLEAVKPKVEFAEALEVSDESILVREMARLIQQATGFKTGGTRFYKWLRENGYLIKRGKDRNLPNQYSTDLGLFVVDEQPVPLESGIRINRTTRVTGKGQRTVS